MNVGFMPRELVGLPLQDYVSKKQSAKKNATTEWKKKNENWGYFEIVPNENSFVLLTRLCQWLKRSEVASSADNDDDEDSAAAATAHALPEKTTKRTNEQSKTVVAIITAAE